MNDRLATWLDLATDSELAAAHDKVWYGKCLPTRPGVKLMTAISLAQRARNLRKEGRIDMAMRLEARREAYLAEHYTEHGPKAGT